MRRIMLDIETLDTRTSAVILSIGVVEFNDTVLLNGFHRYIDIDSCLDKGLTVSGSTILWWMDQSEEARMRLQQPANSLESVLEELSRTFDWQDVEVWANGSDFDLPILANAYRACGYKGAPWPYYMGRDYRTMRKMTPKLLLNEVAVEPECAHDALEDAKAQALTLQGILAAQRWELAA